MRISCMTIGRTGTFHRKPSGRRAGGRHGLSGPPWKWRLREPRTGSHGVHHPRRSPHPPVGNPSKPTMSANRNDPCPCSMIHRADLHPTAGMTASRAGRLDAVWVLHAFSGTAQTYSSAPLVLSIRFGECLPRTPGFELTHEPWHRVIADGLNMYLDCDLSRRLVAASQLDRTDTAEADENLEDIGNLEIMGSVRQATRFCV